MHEIDAIYEIPIDEINVNWEFNSREKVSVESGIEELYLSIKKDGQLAPGEVSMAWPEDQARHGKKYELNSGFRRMFAVQKAGLKTYKATVAPAMSVEDRIKVNVKENMGRKDLNLYEQVKPYIYFIEHGYTEQEIMEKFNQSRSKVQVRAMLARLILAGHDSLSTLARLTNITYETIRTLTSITDFETREAKIQEAIKSVENGGKAKISKAGVKTHRDQNTMLMERSKSLRQALIGWCNSYGVPFKGFGKPFAWANGTINNNQLCDFFEEVITNPCNDERLEEIFEDLETYEDNLEELYQKLMLIKEESAERTFERPAFGFPDK